MADARMCVNALQRAIPISTYLMPDVIRKIARDCVNALQRAIPISTPANQSEFLIRLLCVNALQRAIPISTLSADVTDAYASRVSMPFNGQSPFLRYPLRTRINRAFQKRFLQVIHRMF